MTTILVQISPQRSTQYSELVSILAPSEIELSPLKKQLSSIVKVNIGGQNYLKCEFNAELNDIKTDELGLLAMGSSCFLYFDTLENREGPFLKPLETNFSPAFPTDLVTTRRYQGKTNELFTHFMCNLARYSSDFSQHPWKELRVFDPLSGGGTTIFTALMLGADTAGVEQNKKSAHSTAVFLKQYLEEQHIRFSLKEERLKKSKTSRWNFSMGEKPARCILAKGEITQAAQLVSGFKNPHHIVTDLPYGIQHKGGLNELLTEALPIWESLLVPGGTLVFSWESTRFSRSTMIDLVESTTDFIVLNDPPYNGLTHRVDRVIKERDIIVVRN